MIHFIRFVSQVGGKMEWHGGGAGSAAIVGDFVVLRRTPAATTERVVPMTNIAFIDQDVVKKKKKKPDSRSE